MRPLLSAAALVLLAGPALAQPSPEEVETFVAAVEEMGCVVHTDAEAAAVESATGYSDSKLAEIVAVLLADGRAVVPPSAQGLQLLTEECD